MEPEQNVLDMQGRTQKDAFTEHLLYSAISCVGHALFPLWFHCGDSKSLVDTFKVRGSFSCGQSAGVNGTFTDIVS